MAEEIKKTESTESTESKLNSVIALSNITGIDANKIQEAETNGNLESLVSGFKETNQIFSLDEKADFKANTEKNYIQTLLKSDTVPPELYNKIKGSALEQKERFYKREFDFDGEYKDFDDLMTQIITNKSKNPLESKKEDLDRISKLESEVSGYAEMARKYQTAVESLTESENRETAKVEAINSKWQTKILTTRLSGIINDIPFQDNDNEAQRELMQNGFMSKLTNKVDFKFDENDNVISINKETSQPIIDKVGNPLKLNDVIDKMLAETKLPLKTAKQGDNIISTNGQQQKISNFDDAQKAIQNSERPLSFSEQMAIFDKTSK